MLAHFLSVSTVITAPPPPPFSLPTNTNLLHFDSLSIFYFFASCGQIVSCIVRAAMEGGGGSESGSGLGSGRAPTVPSLPPPCPKSPPPYPDLYGRRRDMARIQMLEREKTFLEEELKFVEGLQPVSRCCKEIVDFVTANGDPLIATNQKISKYRRFWKWLCGPCLSCFTCSWICCCTGCSIHLKPPQCCCSSCQCCKFRDCCSCLNCCSLPKCPCFCDPCCLSTDNCCSCPKISCWNCFKPLKSVFLCSNCCSCSCKCKCSCPKCSCPKCSLCPKCSGGCGCFSCVKDCCNCCCYPCKSICC